MDPRLDPYWTAAHKPIRRGVGRPENGPVVLVIDDEPAVCDLFARILALGGLFPVAAESAEAALQLIQRGLRPDAVLLDLKMPGIGGLGFLLHLRSHPQHATVPVAIVTGDCHLPRPLQRALNVLHAEIHFKPLDLETLLTLTTRLLDPGRYNGDCTSS